MHSRSKYEFPTVQVMHVYEVCPRKDHRGVDLISHALPFGRLWSTGNMIETHEHTGDFKEWKIGIRETKSHHVLKRDG